MKWQWQIGARCRQQLRVCWLQCWCHILGDWASSLVASIQLWVVTEWMLATVLLAVRLRITVHMMHTSCARTAVRRRSVQSRNVNTYSCCSCSAAAAAPPCICMYLLFILRFACVVFLAFCSLDGPAWSLRAPSTNSQGAVCLLDTLASRSQSESLQSTDALIGNTRCIQPTNPASWRLDTRVSAEK